MSGQKLADAINIRHNYWNDDDGWPNVQKVIDSVRNAFARGYLTRSKILQICKEKSARRYTEVERNSSDLIRDVTRLAFKVDSEYVRINLLSSLYGVGVPSASAILAWTKPDRWGVIDRRAWTSLYKLIIVKKTKDGIGLSASHWCEYIHLIQTAAELLKETPVRIDR